ncbi:hypothetical protein A4A49_54867 [Nicotiana attenuata]|uniref:Retrotransposon Copia-like N-terminal domain-containing protein n=1 Tax=Nicotiana attenuata TaxID=49451 RepID=A0A314L561_NICAT|nr:hypothetical protein A4A49_54867 [Nicotiana attenuata]
MASSSPYTFIPLSKPDDTIPSSSLSVAFSPPPLSFPPLMSSLSSMTSLVPRNFSSPSLLPCPTAATAPPIFPSADSLDSTTASNFHSVVALATPNFTNLITIKLQSVEDYLTWHTQFTSFLISHDLLGFVDGSIPAAPPPPSLQHYWFASTESKLPLVGSN